MNSQDVKTTGDGLIENVALRSVDEDGTVLVETV